MNTLTTTSPTYLDSPDIIARERRGKNTGTFFPEISRNSITTSDSNDREIIGSSKTLCVSTCGGMPAIKSSHILKPT